MTEDPGRYMTAPLNQQVNSLAAAKSRRLLPLWLTVGEAAEVLRVDTKTIRRRIQAGKLPVSPHGKPYRIDRDGMFYRAREARARNQVHDWDQDQEEVS